MKAFRFSAIVAGKITRGVLFAFDGTDALRMVRSHFECVANVNVRAL